MRLRAFQSLLLLPLMVRGERDFLQWFGLKEDPSLPQKISEPQILMDKNFGQRPLRLFNTTENETLENQSNKVIRFEEDDPYWCYICIDQHGFNASPVLLAHMVQRRMRVPLPPSCNRDIYAYQVMCKGPCLVATYFRGEDFIGMLRDCAEKADFRSFDESDLRRIPDSQPRNIELGNNIHVEAMLCRGDYCNVGMNQTRGHRAPHDRMREDEFERADKRKRRGRQHQK
ncbi:unnamed protein product, partial [Mesorhabditis belari]|uniref:Uncharacterized protein n=1 Tax=Mesorhabditis belari TaxID=2138241 RepID=A0AAF3EV21_9BILA